ncbi:hypothetical protein Slin14017_G015690 [Septoria linicola]|nr:hypothetical protein Slin14017_G015690 [Septoria linicola]
MTLETRRKVITRNRHALTCTSCRARKLKCDKNLPCGSCSKRGEPTSCTYHHIAHGKVSESAQNAARAEARLEHLENLVQDWLGVSSSNNEVEVEVEPSRNGVSRITRPDEAAVQPGLLTYTGPSHHAASLEDIAELRNVLGEALPETSVEDDYVGYSEMDILFGRDRPLSLAQILLKWLPSRPECDRRLASYFRAQSIVAPFVHVQQFHKQYEAFWGDRYATSPLWISILFSILYLSERTGVLVPPVSPRFSHAATQCLALGQYHRPRQFAVEAITVFIQARLTDGLDLCRELGMLLGIVVPLAYTLGYHREPQQLKHITAFEGEMRRRTWSLILQLDLLNPFQLGLPHNIQAGTWDVNLPGNYDDLDLTESMLSLREPRSDHHITKMIFYIAKHKLMDVFARILKYALCTMQDFQERHLMERQQELEAAYESLPAALHHLNIAQSITDPAMLVMTRRCLDLMYQKCRLVLHRKHITTGRQASIRISYDAAISITKAFVEIITFSDFLMGVMALCLILCQDQKVSILCLAAEDKAQAVHLLRRSQAICLEHRERSTGARRVVRLLSALQSPEHNILKQHESRPGHEVGYNGSDLPEEVVASDVDMEYWQNMFEDPQWALMEDFFSINFDAS